MKKDNKKALRVQGETVRELRLSEAQLADVVGGTNGCISHGTGPSFCNACQN